MENKGHFFDELVAILERLRGPGGCPWDAEQKMEDLRPYIIEEAYELTEAITDRDWNGIREEAGDLLLQIVFVASVAAEENAFGIEDVVAGLRDKLIRRHPHVFGNVSVGGSGEVLRNWEQIKLEERREKQEAPSVLAGVPKGLPALLKAYRMQEKVAHVGFDWDKGNIEPLFAKLREEMAELQEAFADKNPDALEEELGDFLFMTVNLSRHLGLNPDVALMRACGKFAERFRSVERDAAAEGRAVSECSPEELDGFWNKAKKQERQSNT